MAMCGGLGEVSPVTPEVTEICKNLKAEVEGKAGKKFDTYNPLTFASQVVAGVNYFVKIEVDGDEHVHVRIFQPLPHTGQKPSLHSCQMNKTASNALEYF
ncbi:hypothetical protein ACOMHN_021660 [Nucella lapillus]